MRRSTRKAKKVLNGCVSYAARQLGCPLAMCSATLSMVAWMLPLVRELLSISCFLLPQPGVEEEEEGELEDESEEGVDEDASYDEEEEEGALGFYTCFDGWVGSFCVFKLFMTCVFVRECPANVPLFWTVEEEDDSGNYEDEGSCASAFAHSLTHSLIHSLIHSLTDSLTHSLTLSLTDSLTH